MASEVERSVIDALLKCLPLSDDGTGHVVDCGYDEDAPSCGCLSLPGRLAAVIAAHDAEVAARAWNEGWKARACGEFWQSNPCPGRVPGAGESARGNGEHV